MLLQNNVAPGSIGIDRPHDGPSGAVGPVPEPELRESGDVKRPRQLGPGGHKARQRGDNPMVKRQAGLDQ